MKRDIEPLDENGRKHGYHEVYTNDGKIWYIGTYHNGRAYGYFEYHYYWNLLINHEGQDGDVKKQYIIR